MPAEPEPTETKRINLEVVNRPPRRNPWRPTILTIRKFLRICHHIEQGEAITQACELESISYRNFRFRVSNSLRLQERLKESETVRFNLRHEEALASVIAAGERSWMAHAWWLERCLPQLYALRSVNREHASAEQPIGNEIPAERLAEYGRLMLEFAEENKAKQAQAVELPESSVEQSA